MPISEAQDALGIKDDRPSQEGNSEGIEMVRESPLRRAFCCLGSCPRRSLAARLLATYLQGRYFECSSERREHYCRHR